MSHTSSAVRTTAVCLAAGSVTMTMTVVITRMKTSVVGFFCCSYFVDGHCLVTQPQLQLTVFMNSLIYSVLWALLYAHCSDAAGYSGKPYITFHYVYVGYTYSNACMVDCVLHWVVLWPFAHLTSSHVCFAFHTGLLLWARGRCLQINHSQPQLPGALCTLSLSFVLSFIPPFSIPLAL